MPPRPTPDRLPRGRHKLARGEVVAAQRERLLRGLADAMAEKGYARTTVADVLARARVSRETFYEQFASKEDCFMSAFEDANAHMLAAITGEEPVGGGPPPATPLARLERFLRAYLDALAAEPARARVFLIEVYAAGPEAARRRAELQGRLAAALAADFGLTDPGDLFALEALVAAVSALVTQRLAVGDVDGLRALHGPLMGLVANLPFVARRAGAP